jgi:RNA 2',3'-cyclic 3'-phosphodiesterase
LRLFIAINLPEPETRRLSTALYRLAAQDVAVRWVDVASLHITLKFLGEVADQRLAAVQAALEEAVLDAPAFEVSVGGLGAFPSLARPNIFWVGVEGPPELDEVYQRIEEAMSGLGFEKEERPFKPHITLGRVRKDGRVPDRKRMDRMAADFDYKGEFRVQSIDLMRSRLSPRGARYEVVQRMDVY